MSGVNLEVKYGEGEPRRGYNPESALRGTETAPLASLGIAEDAGQNCLLERKGRASAHLCSHWLRVTHRVLSPPQVSGGLCGAERARTVGGVWGRGAVRWGWTEL